MKCGAGLIPTKGKILVQFSIYCISDIFTYYADDALLTEITTCLTNKQEVACLIRETSILENLASGSSGTEYHRVDRRLGSYSIKKTNLTKKYIMQSESLVDQFFLS